MASAEIARSWLLSEEERLVEFIIPQRHGPPKSGYDRPNWVGQIARLVQNQRTGLTDRLLDTQTCSNCQEDLFGPGFSVALAEPNSGWATIHCAAGGHRSRG